MRSLFQLPGPDPTGSFTILEPHNQEISKFGVVQERRALDYEARTFLNGSIGKVDYPFV